MKAAEKVAPQTVAQLRGHTMSVFGPEIDVAWAYRLDWDPIPVIQSYSAYTPALDRLDARFVDSARAPTRILLGAATTTAPDLSIDNRVLGFDEPATTRAILCNYRVLSEVGAWAVLARVDARCSPSERLIEIRHVAWGGSIAIPRPPTRRSFVMARVSGVDVGGLEELGAFFKPALSYIGLGSSAYRFVSANEGDGLVRAQAPALTSPVRSRSCPRRTSSRSRGPASRRAAGRSPCASTWATTPREGAGVGAGRRRVRPSRLAWVSSGAG